ncbi:uncharacterized protein LOC120072327 [Benincasa hispida]|uniref:uncharacterized protein LOC120072327 n=1 Tax=Benincasa hispida TaxID=102211 RepID=UPI001902AD8E|nr:uncharacterized protein LOC120072327 [Benincasa hispida]XP_038880728.1 uncharacterized protein LOC120072327 [Benincasa hispida]
MEKEESASKRMRIYVGGLGAAMTEDDLRKVFQSVGGVVEAVDFIRTKSRSFAYVDFFPSFQSSLSKLFSTYNGCAWKGGKLRLEKAKENYLARLRREWEEDAQITDSNVGADMEVVAPEFTEHVAKSQHIRIFFPSLGEVKSLPISGTGTHKYDFPHVEVPPLPVHFCDCEEHNVSSPIGNSKDTQTRDLNAQNGGMDEDEIKMMNAVLNKLFERQEASQSSCKGTMALNDKHNSSTLTDNQLLEDNEVDSDEDNLVLNVMASNCNSKTMPLNSGNKIFKAHGSSKGAARDQKNNSRVQSKKRKSVISEEFDGNESVPSISTSYGGTDPSYDPARSSRPQAPDRGPPIQSSRSHKSSWKTLIHDKSNVSFSISDILPSVPTANEEQAEADNLNLAHSTSNRNSDLATAAVLGSKMDEIQSGKINVSFSITDVLPSVASEDREEASSADLNLAHSTPNRNTDVVADPISKSISEEMISVESFPEAQCTIPNVTSNKGRGSSWRQKSSWTQLVSEEITSFSITQILPNNTYEKQVQGESDAINVNLSARSEINASKKQDSQCIAEDESAAFVIRKDEIAWNDVKKKEPPAVQECKPSPTQIIESNLPQQAGSFDVISGETCPFMRNSWSVAEWTKIKAALSGGSKKKKQRQ